MERLYFRKKKTRGSKNTSKNRNLASMEREARETRERASNASKARAERAARTARAGATRQRTAARREWREPPEDGDSKPVRSRMPLRGRYAACAGRFEVGASRSPRVAWKFFGNPCKNEQQQGESGESLPRIETASPYDRLCPCAAATPACAGRFELGASRSHRVACKFFGNPD